MGFAAVIDLQPVIVGVHRHLRVASVGEPFKQPRGVRGERRRDAPGEVAAEALEQRFESRVERNVGLDTGYLLRQHRQPLALALHLVALASLQLCLAVVVPQRGIGGVERLDRRIARLRCATVRRFVVFDRRQRRRGLALRLARRPGSRLGSSSLALALGTRSDIALQHLALPCLRLQLDVLPLRFGQRLTGRLGVGQLRRRRAGSGQRRFGVGEREPPELGRCRLPRPCRLAQCLFTLLLRILPRHEVTPLGGQRLQLLVARFCVRRLQLAFKPFHQRGAVFA